MRWECFSKPRSCGYSSAVLSGAGAWGGHILHQGQFVCEAENRFAVLISALSPTSLLLIALALIDTAGMATFFSYKGSDDIMDRGFTGKSVCNEM